jgi:hypothetical protein
MIGFLKKKYLSFVGYLCSLPLASYLVHPPDAGYTGFGCRGLATFGAAGHRLFFPMHMGGGLVYGFIATREFEILFVCLAVCYLLGRSRK